jgi:hypothetical protein
MWGRMRQTELQDGAMAGGALAARFHRRMSSQVKDFSGSGRSFVYLLVRAGVTFGKFSTFYIFLVVHDTN